ncbi:transposase family protein [Actinomadura geliboluensis]|uniref:transposase family protein n=1 Tax=Actinomadura geliboluensis TaxID=882440 RepID=UPI0036CAE0B0
MAAIDIWLRAVTQTTSQARPGGGDRPPPSPGDQVAEAAAGFGGVGGHRLAVRREIVALVSARSPKLGAALHRAKTDRLTRLVLDGTLIHTNRVKADCPCFSGKHRAHGMNVQVIAGPDGTILCTSGATPCKIQNLNAARI